MFVYFFFVFSFSFPSSSYCNHDIVLLVVIVIVRRCCFYCLETRSKMIRQFIVIIILPLFALVLVFVFVRVLPINREYNNSLRRIQLKKNILKGILILIFPAIFKEMIIKKYFFFVVIIIEEQKNVAWNRNFDVFVRLLA